MDFCQNVCILCNGIKLSGALEEFSISFKKFGFKMQKSTFKKRKGVLSEVSIELV